MNTKYIFITGGVCSSLGKGIAASSIGALIEAHGYKINIMKIDPYLNVDAGTMSPLEHGEVYVTQDGGETDLDAGNYERFTHHINQKKHFITTGQIYQTVIKKERQGKYLGKCIQLIPHLTDEIKQRIQQGTTPGTDVLIIEIGGTVGDIESNLFLEAARQLASNLDEGNVVFIHVTLVPFLEKAEEFKTKPTQHSVQKLREIGIQPNILLCRTKTTLSPQLKRKISLFTQVQENAVIEAIDCPHTIYQVPLQYHNQGLSKTLLSKLGLANTPANMDPWNILVNKITHLKEKVEIALVGKYVALKDADLSVYEALSHAGLANGVHVKVRPINSEDFTQAQLQGIHGILVPGGFGTRGIEGMIAAAHYAKTQHVPYMGICLGMQTMVIAHARHTIGLKNAHSTEFDPHTTDPIVHFLEGQETISHKGGSMRLGIYTSEVIPNTLLAHVYGTNTIKERHRHRYEINNAYIEELEKNGMTISCMTGESLVEAVEWQNHPFGIGVQYHPEFQSKPTQPHPIFKNFIASAAKLLKK